MAPNNPLIQQDEAPTTLPYRTSRNRAEQAGNRPKKKYFTLSLSDPSTTDIQKNEITRAVPSVFGSILPGKQPSTIRLFFQNIGGLPKTLADVSNTKWASRLRHLDIDIALLAEVNMFWPNTAYIDSIHARIKHFWKASRSTTSHNRHSGATSTHCQGGTASLLLGDIAHRGDETGVDPKGLGRWSWQTIKGPHQSFIKVILAYAPSKTKNGIGSVWCQHQIYLSTHNNDCDPRAAFFEDLADQIKAWTTQGHYIVLGLDANIDTLGHFFTQWASQLHLLNPLSFTHGPVPPTFIRGSMAIDAILLSDNVPFLRCGMIHAKDTFDSDHHSIWLDIDASTLLGQFKFAPNSIPRRLTVTDRRAQNRYIRDYELILSNNNVIPRIHALLQRADQGWSQQCVNKLEAIDRIRVQGMIKAESTCRKLRMGNHVCSPNLTRAYNTKCYISLRIALLEGRSILASTLRRAKQGSLLKIPSRTPKEELHDMLLQVTKEIQQAAKLSEEDRQQWQSIRARQLSEIDGIPVASIFAEYKDRQK